MRLSGFANITCHLELDELAELISRELGGGIEFVKDQDGVLDEVPAMYTPREFLGLRLMLAGCPGDYGLWVEQWDDKVRHHSTDATDLSDYVVFLLSRIDGIESH